MAAPRARDRLFLLVGLMMGSFAMPRAESRLIRFWHYDELVKEADVIAIVVADSTRKANEVIKGAPREQKYYQAHVATLRPLWVIKGDATAKELTMLYFGYAEEGLTEPNGALFLSGDKLAKKPHLVFLKRDSRGFLVPVTGDYDARISVKEMQEDPYSPPRSGEAPPAVRP